MTANESCVATLSAYPLQNKTNKKKIPKEIDFIARKEVFSAKLWPTFLRHSEREVLTISFFTFKPQMPSPKVIPTLKDPDIFRYVLHNCY